MASALRNRVARLERRHSPAPAVVTVMRAAGETNDEAVARFVREEAVGQAEWDEIAARSLIVLIKCVGSEAAPPVEETD